MDELAEQAQDNGWGGGGAYITKYRYDLLDYLSWVAAVVRIDDNYVTSTVAKEHGKEATAWKARRAMLPGNTVHLGNTLASDWAYARQYRPTEADAALATAAREFVMMRFEVSMAGTDTSDDDALKDMLLNAGKEGKELSDFEHNLFVCAKGESVEARTFGIAAYIVQYYRKENGLIQKKDRHENSQHQGEVKQRLRGLTVTVEHCFPIDSFEFNLEKLIMVDPNGNVYTWLTGSANMVKGGTYVIDGTVKKHTEWKGVKQTQLNRCTIKTVVSEPQAAIAA